MTNVAPASVAGGVPQGASAAVANPLNGAVQIFLPANNVRGAILRNAWGFAGTLGQVTGLFTGTVVPVSANSNQPIFMVSNQQVGALTIPVFIPPGQGLWFFAGSAASGCWADYDLL
jgi:hypothetical protein